MVHLARRRLRLLRGRRRELLSVNRKVGTIHPAQIAAAALLRRDHVRRMVALGIESGREGQHLCRAELHTKAAGLTALHNDRNASFCHGPPQSESVGHSRISKNYGLSLSHRGVTRITDTREAEHRPGMTALLAADPLRPVCGRKKAAPCGAKKSSTAEVRTSVERGSAPRAGKRRRPETNRTRWLADRPCGRCFQTADW